MFEFFDSIYQFLTVDMWATLSDYAAYLMAKITILWIEGKIYFIGFAWQVGQAIISELNLTAAIDAAWGSIDSETYSTLAFFKIPDALNLIMASYPARMFLKMMGA